MPFSVLLRDMIAALVRGWPKLEEKDMFGGIGYLLEGNMLFGIYHNWLILRVGEEQAALLLKEEGVKPLDITGKPMKGWVMLPEARWHTEEDLNRWLHLARDFAAALPKK